jgi:hypothetical protein
MAELDGEVVLTAEEIQETLDHEARRRGFGDSWTEAVDRYNRGGIDSGDIGDLLILSDLLRETPAA